MARSMNRGLQCGKFETKSYRVEPLHPRRLICATGEGGARKRRIGGDEGRRIYRWRVLATKEREEKNSRCWHNISEEIHGGKGKSYGGHAWLPDYYSSGIHRRLDIRQNVTHIKRINDRRPCNNEARYVLVSFYIF